MGCWGQWLYACLRACLHATPRRGMDILNCAYIHTCTSNQAGTGIGRRLCILGTTLHFTRGTYNEYASSLHQIIRALTTNISYRLSSLWLTISDLRSCCGGGCCKLLLVFFHLLLKVRTTHWLTWTKIEANQHCLRNLPSHAEVSTCTIAHWSKPIPYLVPPAPWSCSSGRHFCTRLVLTESAFELQM